MPSHGSLTKAGKVRSATPKIQPKPKGKTIPRTRNRVRYFKRFIYPTLVATNVTETEA